MCTVWSVKTKVLEDMLVVPGCLCLSLIWDSLCMLLPLAVKEAVSAYGLIERSQVGNVNRDIESRQSQRDAM